MPTFFAIIPHDSGMHPPIEPTITGQTTAELRASAMESLYGGRYVSRICALIGPDCYMIYSESGGWLITDPTDEEQIRRKGSPMRR